MKLIPELRFSEFPTAEGWDIKELGEITEIVRGGSPRPIQEYLTTDNDGLNWLKIADVSSDSKYITGTKEKVIQEAINNTREVNPGDLILSNSMSFGRPYILKIKTCIHDGWIAIRKISNTTFEDYLYYFISSESSQKYFQVNAAGAAVKNLNAEIIKLLPIYLPKEKEEQQKITSCLSSLDELLAAHSDKLQALKDHKKGLMQNLFPQEGQKVPSYRFPEFENDGEWVSERLNEVAAISSGGTPSRVKKEYWNGNIPWVSTTLIDFNEIKKANEFITPLGLENSSTKIFPKGTILMAMYGQGKTRGKVAILDLDAAINQACAAIKLKTGMNVNFVFQNLASRYDEIRSISNQGGQDNLSGELVKNIPICYPNIKSREQQKIASCLSALDKLITTQAEKIVQLQLHKKGLMQGLFPRVEN